MKVQKALLSLTLNCSSLAESHPGRSQLHVFLLSSPEGLFQIMVEHSVHICAEKKKDVFLILTSHAGRMKSVAFG